MTPEESQFRTYESYLLGICRAYPSPSILTTTSRTGSYMRQILKRTLESYHDNAAWQSEICRETVAFIIWNWVWSDDGPNQIYIGPRRNKKRDRVEKLNRIAEANSTAPTVAPINCTDNAIFLACCTLKNSELLPFPLPLFNVTPDQLSHAELAFPNTEFSPQTDPGHYLLL